MPTELDYVNLNMKFFSRIGSPFDFDLPINTKREDDIPRIFGKRILVIRMLEQALAYALHNSVVYLTDNADKYNEFTNKVNEEKYGSDDEAFMVNDWKHFNKDIEGMKFDVVIGNPPYEGKGHPLYLQILEEVNKVSDRVIWLCPAQWTKNYKDSKYLKQVKFDTCKNLISHQTIKNPFQDAGLANEVGIYEFGKSDKYEDYETIRLERFKNPKLTKSIWNKFETYAHNLGEMTRVDLNKKKYVYASKIRGNVHNLGEMTRVDLNKKKYVYASKIRGHFHESKPCWDWTTLFGEEQRNTIYETKMKCHWHFWNFDTNKECKNFIASTETDILMFAHYISKINCNNNNQVLQIIPWFSDYTKKWTEPMIQKELGLTDEEVEYIHEEMKDFGWKAQPKKKKK